MSAQDSKPTLKAEPRRSWLLIIAPVLLALGLGVLFMKEERDGGSAVAQLAQQAGFTEDQAKSVEAIVKGYLLEHPEILIEMQQALEVKMAKEEAEKTKAMVATHAKELYRKPDDAVAGNPDGDITVVEFFDYNCGYCKRGFGGIASFLEQDKNVRFVFKELPIIRDESEGASKVALAAKRQGKYWEMHQALIQTKGMVTQAEGLKAAEKLGLDMAKLREDMDSDAVKDEIESVKTLAQKMGINGTPHFLVGDKAIGGAPENLADILEGHVADLRKSGCSYC